MKKAFFRLCLLVLLFVGVGVHAQTHSVLISGPMLGQANYRTAAVWVEAQAGKQPLLRFWRQDNKKESWVVKGVYQAAVQKHGFNTILYYIIGLDVNTVYEYELETRFCS